MRRFIPVYLTLLVLALQSFAYSQGTERIEVAIFADSAVIADIDAWENCAARFTQRVERSDNAFLITQTDTIPEKMRCMCRYRLETVLTGLAPGTYTVRIQRVYLEKYGYGHDTTVQVGVATFTVALMQSAISQLSRQGECTLLGVDHAQAPSDFSLSVHPNPSRGMSQLRLQLEATQHVTMTLYDEAGTMLRSVFDGFAQSGSMHLSVETASLAAGVYFVVAIRGGHIAAVPLYVRK